ncbi:BON domain-containing protein [Sinimarinibacterium sp. CAU 1509]|uniref:BON domain-containing protein n=1 Tax=Sinimarinibacterium sp. CAU 1509 TaxID=2562283 RepID=UPI0010AD602C|nr:BON domain-containing protein [Sinimarinibacterium sp. CAU 1509]TJY61013.1 BON domain-containing protein [Sinimarinibacterium sp. CAU 1509]
MNHSFRKTLMASAIALSSFGVGSTAFASDTVGQNMTEARQETQIWTTYALSPNLRANDLKVSVHGGKATLSGTVEEGVNKDLAKQIALGVKGVTEVDNQIVVQPEYVAAVSTERSYGQVVDDATITSTVKSKLLWSKYTDGLSTDVDTNRGNVKLIGTADSEAAKSLAGQLAGNTRGVASVDNQLVVKTPKPGLVDKTKAVTQEAGNDIADGWISTKVKSMLLYSSNVEGSDITVDTQNGVVTLSGKVDSGAERALAIELASNVRGVKSVQSKALKF